MGLAYVGVLVVFKEDVSLELSAAGIHATNRQAKMWELPEMALEFSQSRLRTK